MAQYQPVFQTEYLASQFINSPEWSGLVESGVVDFTILDGKTLTGDYIYMPQVAPVAYQRIDPTSNTPVTPSRISTNDQKYPQLRNAAFFQWRDTDSASANEDLMRKQMVQEGDEWAKRVLTQVLLTMKAGVPSALTLDYTGQVPTLQMLRKLKYNLLGSQGSQVGKLNTFVCHSSVLSGLKKDILATYPSNPALSGSDMRVFLRDMFGIEYVVVTDLVPYTNAGAPTAADDALPSFLCNPRSVVWGYQLDSKIASSDDATLPGGAHNIQLINVSGGGLRATQWTGGANPSDSNLGTTGNWSAAYTSIKEIGVVKLISKGNDE